MGTLAICDERSGGAPQAKEGDAANISPAMEYVTQVLGGVFLLIGIVVAIARRNMERSWRGITFWFVWAVLLALVARTSANLAAH